MKSIICNYGTAHSNCKVSGTHTALCVVDKVEIETKFPFSDFVNNNNFLLYIHAFVYRFPNVLEKITGKLPETSSNS